MTHTDSPAGGKDLSMPDGFILPAPHPGETIAEELEARGLSVSRAALMMRMPQSRLHRIVKGERGVTGDSALRLGLLLGVSAEFFMRLQAAHDLFVAQQQHGEQIRAEVQAA